MSLYNVFDIAGSGMHAQSMRMNVAASNLANANSVAGPDGEPYRAKQAVFELDAPRGKDVGGVRVRDIVEDDSPLKQTYDPGNPLANEDGYVMMPNVDPVEETVNMISASRSYQANIQIINTSKKLMLRTLTIGE